jgi:hypothetical protein
VLVQKPYQKQGLAFNLLRLLNKEAQKIATIDEKNRVKFVVVRPGVVDWDEDYKEECRFMTEAEKSVVKKREYGNAVGFYRSQGLQRIGRSKWFGLALSRRHPSRKIGVEEDLDPKEAEDPRR